MASRRDALKIIGAAIASNTLAAGAAEPETLKSIAAAKGMRFGNAIGILDDEKNGARFSNPAYRALMARECATMVAENEMKWPQLQPRPGAWQFEPADRMVAWARQESMLVRGHTLVWQSPRWLPDWVNKHDFGTRPTAMAERLLDTHIGTVCGHFGKDVFSYDVVNEAVEPGDGSLIQNVLGRHLGTLEQIDLAFRLARRHAPWAQLVYNDYMGPEQGSARHRAGVLKLLADLKARGTPIDALGLQSHIGDALPAASLASNGEWRKFLDEVTAMGYDLLVTEFDVNDRKLPAASAERDIGVAAIARDYLDLTLSYPRCRDFLLWGMADHVNWLQVWEKARRPDGLPQRPTPYDDRLGAKPLRATIAKALRDMPQRA